MTAFQTDDPRVLRLAQARQEIGRPILPPWEELTDEQRHASLIMARGWLRAVAKAGLLADEDDGGRPVPMHRQLARDIRGVAFDLQQTRNRVKELHDRMDKLEGRSR